MKEKMYLISHDDYVKHIDDCVMLYGMLHHVCELVSQIPQNRGSKALTDMAADCSEKAKTIMEHSGIPSLYPLFGDERFLRPLMNEELIVAIPVDEYDKDEDKENEDEETYNDEGNEPSLEEIIALTLSDLADAAQEMNRYLHTITQHLKK